MSAVHTFLLFCYVYFGAVACLIAVLLASARYALVPSDRKRCEIFIVAAVYSCAMLPVFAYALSALSGLRPIRLDYYIFQIDALFGQPAFWMGRLLESSWLLKVPIILAYDSLQFAMVAVFGFCLWCQSKESARHVLATFVLVFAAAIPVYLILPVSGPRYAFPGFPYSAPAHLVVHSTMLTAPPNGIPSCHFATALVIAWFLRETRRGRIVGIAFVALTFMATLGTGEHYLVDLIIAVPYAAACCWAAGKLLEIRKVRIPEPALDPIIPQVG